MKKYLIVVMVALLGCKAKQEENVLPKTGGMEFRDMVGASSMSIRSNGKDYNINNYILLLMEDAYFHGQKDAINGDIRIAEDFDGCYKWSESPWEDTREFGSEVYIPICEDEEDTW